MLQCLRLVMVLVLGGAFAACEPGPVAIPPGAQQVEVNATASGVTLTPATVSAGDVYLVLNFSGGAGTVVLVRAGSGGLTDAQITQLKQTGDAGVGAEYDVEGAPCCGNVVKETFVAGNYAILMPDSTASEGAVVPPVATAILQVTP